MSSLHMKENLRPHQYQAMDGIIQMISLLSNTADHLRPTKREKTYMANLIRNLATSWDHDDSNLNQEDDILPGQRSPVGHRLIASIGTKETK